MIDAVEEPVRQAAGKALLQIAPAAGRQIERHGGVDGRAIGLRCRGDILRLT